MDALVSTCSGNTNVIMVWAWMRWRAHALETRTLLCFGHGCSRERVLWKHERYYGLGMDALVSACSGNTNVIMVWAWMRWRAHALETRTLLWFGHGCSGERMDFFLSSAFCRAASSAAKLACQPRSMANSTGSSSGCMARKAALRPRSLRRPETPETATCAKYCAHQYFCTLCNERCLKVLRLPAKLQP